MKRYVCFCAVLFLFILLVSCAKDAEVSNRSPNGVFRIDTLFTHEGITVYRFSDAGEYIYFASKGDTSWHAIRSAGKTIYTVQKNVQTINDQEQ